MNILSVNKNCTVYAASGSPRDFTVGEEVAPNSPYYYPILWAGLGTDTGREGVAGADDVITLDRVVVGPTDPQFGTEGLWIQDLGNGNYTFWYEDGK